MAASADGRTLAYPLMGCGKGTTSYLGVADARTGRIRQWGGVNIDGEGRGSAIVGSYVSLTADGRFLAYRLTTPNGRLDHHHGLAHQVRFGQRRPAQPRRRELWPRLQGARIRSPLPGRPHRRRLHAVRDGNGPAASNGPAAHAGRIQHRDRPTAACAWHTAELAGKWARLLPKSRQVWTLSAGAGRTAPLIL